ncbi:MAG: FHA domain-containing protein [Planctomycetota bacterium]|nr:FHA domain-containing protein [Planctomycetota bacterium]
MNQVKLVVVGGAAKATELVIRPPVVLGRGHEASIPLPHPLVSRLHCEIVHQQGRLLVRDLGSLNGTFVGNQRVSEAELPSGELLTVGSVTFRAEYEVDTDLFAPESDVDVSPEDVPEAAEDSRLSVAELPAAFEGQSETDDHPVDQLTPAHPVIDEFPDIQEESPPLAISLEPELPDAGGDSQLSIADLPVAFAVSPEAVSPEAVSPQAVSPEAVSPKAVSPEAVSPEAVSPKAVSPEAVSPEAVSPEAAPLAVDVPGVDGAATPVPDEIPLATVLKVDNVAEVQVDEDSQVPPAVSGEETRDAVELEREDGESTADGRPAPSARPDSLDFSVAPELNGSDSGTRSVYDSTMDEDLKRFLKNLE